jgi:alpha-glucosidase
MKQLAPWNQTVLYQLYPWSFNEDKQRTPQRGHGSIRGIIEKIPYLVDVGITGLWLCPPYPGPMRDNGYDIADYVGIHPELGTLDDFDDLVTACHEHGIRIMLDFIPNHSSDTHEWFQKSRRRLDGYDDWYIWHPGKKDSDGNPIPPNNWPSIFSALNRQLRDEGKMPWLKEGERTPAISAWKWDDLRGEFYLRSFSDDQPDLNWENPDVREAMKDNMRFWIDRGVDGFRMDAVNHMAKNRDFTDEEYDPDFDEFGSSKHSHNPYYSFKHEHSSNYPDRLFFYVRELCSVLRDEKYKDRDLKMVLESYLDDEQLAEINNIDPEKTFTFNFGPFYMDWDAPTRQAQMDEYYANFHSDGVPNQTFGNHDNPRLATRFGDNPARAMAVMGLFAPGMNIIYSSEELGLHNCDISPDKCMDQLAFRDGQRTPIIWDDTQPNAGFSNADPANLWLPINENDLGISVVRQQTDPTSFYTLYKTAIHLRQEMPSIREGEYEGLKSDNKNVLAYARKTEGEQSVILVNFSPESQKVSVTGDYGTGTTVLSSLDVATNVNEVNVGDGIELRPDEAIVVKLG